MKKLIAMLLITGSTVVLPAEPTFFTGGDLLASLRSADKTEQLAAASYLAGAFDGTWAAMHCASKPTLANMLAAVRDELERVEKESPETLRLPAARFLVIPLMNFAPCRQGKSV